MVIIDGAHLCSTHALDVTLGGPRHPEQSDPMVVDLRESDVIVGVEDVTELVRRLAS